MSCNEKYDLCIDAGATFNLNISIGNTDITGYDFRMQFRRNIDSSDFAFEATISNGYFTIEDATNGCVSLNIPDSITSTLSGTYVYDIEMISDTLEVTRILKGTVTVSPEVTR